MWGEEGDVKTNRIVRFFSRENLQSMIKYYGLFYYVLEVFEI